MNHDRQTVVERLAQGPKSGLGCANELAQESLHSQDTLRAVVAALRDKRSVVTRRAANALKTIAAADSRLLAPHAHGLLRVAAQCADLQTRWNLVIVIGGLPLRGRDRALAIDLLFEAIASGSGFLRTFTLTGLADLSQADPALRRRVQPLLQKALDDPSAAVRARGRKLLQVRSKSALTFQV